MISRIRKSGAARNFGWLVADRGVRLAVSVVVGSWVARYLGKQDFGLLSYALALVAIFAALTPLGMEALTVREIIQDPRQGGRWIGTIIGFRATTALISALLAVATVFGLRHHEPRAWILVAILSLGVLFQSLESGELWFQAHTQMRSLVLPRLVLFFFMNFLKILAVVRGAGVVWFALFTALEQIVSGALTWFIVRKSLGPGNHLAFEATRGWRLLRECWPLAVSALSVILYMKMSQLILSGLLGDAALGIYAAAIRVPEAGSFLPMVLASSFLPSLLRSRSEGARSYLAARLRYFRLNILLSLSVAFPLSIGAPLIIRTLFGPSYRDAAPVLSVYAWSLIFVFLGVARGQCLLNEKHTKLALWYCLLGLSVSIVSGFMLIPRFGPTGAAVATVFSYFISAFISSFIHPVTRPLVFEQLEAILTPWKLWTFPGIVPEAKTTPQASL